MAPEQRFQAVEIEGLADRQHVQDLIILASALLHRADRVTGVEVERGQLARRHLLAQRLDQRLEPQVFAVLG